ncbi:MAG: macro domain-containing protein [Anaerolineae bacterium]|nr:macro domain-containing protein [Anaerolineae bacterium]
MKSVNETSELRLILVDPNVSLCDAFRERFDGAPNVEIVQDRFERLPKFDCMVSPANSFGIMDGGVDAAITRFFGHELQTRVQRHILSQYLGEQPVGTSIIVETKHPKHPYLAHTPTMRVPMEIAHTDNVYLAMWAMLLAVRRHNQQEAQKIEIIACPGLGTGTGRVPFHEAARQMALAYQYFLNPPTYLNWHVAGERQAQVRYGGDMGFHISPDVKW